MAAFHLFLTRPSVRQAIVLLCLGLGGCATGPGPAAMAPRSTLPRKTALSIAQLVAASINGQVYVIAPTGSMRPTLDEGSIVTAEPVSLEKLRKGDIVIYQNHAGDAVIHRLYAHQGNRWYVLGDSNTAVDRETVNAHNLLGRVCLILYTSSGSGSSALAGPGRPLTAVAIAN